MDKTKQKRTLYVVLLVAFIDFFGVGLVYPLFSSMLFDPAVQLLASETTPTVRGVWLGILLAMMPLAQFFSSPLWGVYADGHGRKKPLQLSIAMVLAGYIVAVVGTSLNNILILLLSRIIIGIAAGNTSVVQATIADISSPEDKAKNFGLFSMALGLGLAFGPFLGGLLSAYGYSIPFLFAAGITVINLIFAYIAFEETHFKRVIRKLSPAMAITELKEAFQFEGLKAILVASFLYNFGWSYFFEFAPVYLIRRFDFSSVQLGIFYGSAGAFYALSTGLLIRPVLDKFKHELLFLGGIFLTALMVFSLEAIPSIIWIWPVMFLMCFFVSFVTPTSITLVSNSANEEVQGAALGNLNAVNAAAFMLSPLFSGSLVGAFPAMPIWLGGSIMILACLLFVVALRGRKTQMFTSTSRRGERRQ